jgi:hypothetical protein
LILRIAPEAFQSAAPADQWTMRQLLLAVDVDPAYVAMWRVNGAAFPGAGGTNPLLDLPIPPPVPGADPNIVVSVALPALHAVFPPAMVVPGPAPKGNGAPAAAPPPLAGFSRGNAMSLMPAAPGVPAGLSPVPIANPVGLAPGSNQNHEPVIPAPAHLMEAYEHVEQDWRACQEAEKDLARLRQQCLDMMGRLKALNRDLTGPERLHSNNQEKKDWQNARRMLRDCTNRLWKSVKAHDIGYTSSAGQRRWFEATYDKYIAPRLHFDGFQDADRAFGTYRKIVTTLHIEMTNGLSIAQLDGERRAQQILARIAEKIREAGNRKNFLGVMLDS